MALPAAEFHDELGIGDVHKHGFSTMYPANWTPDQTKAAIRQAWTDPAGTRETAGVRQRADQSTFWPPNPHLTDAFDHVFEGHVTYFQDEASRTQRPTARWSGTGGGLRITGYFDFVTGECITAYPLP